MRIGNTNIALSGQSNFVVQFAVDSNASRREIESKRNAVATNLKTNLVVLKNYFSKVVGLDTNYPKILGCSSDRKYITVRQPTLEIWAGRALAIYGVYNVLKQVGVL